MGIQEIVALTIVGAALVWLVVRARRGRLDGEEASGGCDACHHAPSPGASSRSDADAVRPIKRP
jgi:hypothetical protein